MWKSRWTSWSSPSLTGLCGRNAASNNNLNSCPEFRSPWAVWKSRWTSWSSPSLTGLCGRNAASSNNLNSCPEFRSPGAVSESRGGRPGLPRPYGLSGRKATLNDNFNSYCSELRNFRISELRNCVNEQVDVLDSPPSLIVRKVSVDVKQHRTTTWTVAQNFRTQGLCDRRGGRPGLAVPHCPYRSLWT